MRNCILSAVFLMLIENSFAQQSQVYSRFSGDSYSESINMTPAQITLTSLPQPILDSWEKNYSAVKGMQWYYVADGYMVYYDYKNFQSRVLFDANGKVRMHSREVDSESIPVAILNFMNKKYPGAVIEKMYVTFPVAGENYFEMQIGNNWERFDVNGNNIEDRSLVNQAKR